MSRPVRIDSLTSPDLPVPRIAAAIRTLRRAWPAVYERLYPEAAANDIGSGLADALLILTLRHPEGVTMSALAESMRVEASTATRAVDRLVERGLAERSRSVEDGRVAFVKPTPAGIELRQRLTARAREEYEALLAREFDDSELDLVAVTMERLVAAFDWQDDDV